MQFHVGYLVKDRHALADFYRQVLGFEMAYSFSVPARNMKEIMEIETSAEAIVLERDGIKLEFLELKLGPPAATPSFHLGIHHLALRVPNPEDTIKLAASLGGRVRQTFRQDHMTYYIEDPEGNIVEVSKAREE